MIWRIFGSLRLSQNLVINYKFSWPRSLAKFQILTTFSSLSILPCERIPCVKMVFWRISISLRTSKNFVKNLKSSWLRSLAKFQILTAFSSLWIMTCEWFHVSKWYSKVFFLLIWRISRSLRLSQNFAKYWKFSWPRSLAKFQILTTFSSLSIMTCEWIPCLEMVF